MSDFRVVLALLVAVVALATLARRVHLPYPIVLVLGGLLLGLAPGLPQVRLEPDLILVLFLPPLVYGAAWQVSPRDLWANLRSILLLAVGLVVATTLVVALVSYLAIAELNLLPAFVLGAIVSPTDTVAAGAILGRLSVPRRIATVLEGESLINDATGLVAYSLALTAIAHNGAFSPPVAVLEFVRVSAGGAAIGLLVGIAAGWAQARIHEAPVEITFSLLAPFVAYLPAEALGVSGVLAVVVAGLYGARQEARVFSSESRLQAYAVWQTMTFVANGLIFILVGLQLRGIVDDITPLYSLPRLLWYAMLVSLAVIGARIVWVLVSAALLPRRANPCVPPSANRPDLRQALVLSWTGMRGGVSLAAALALTAGGALSRSQIGLITFLVFGVILSTLLLQGLTLPLLIGRLDIADEGTVEREEALAHIEVSRVALARLAEFPPTAGIAHLRHPLRGASPSLRYPTQRRGTGRCGRARRGGQPAGRRHAPPAPRVDHRRARRRS